MSVSASKSSSSVPNPPGFARQLVLRIVGRGARRAEEGRGGADVGQRIEAPVELVLNAFEPRGVRERRDNRLLLSTDQFFVGRRRHAGLWSPIIHSPSRLGERQWRPHL